MSNLLIEQLTEEYNGGSDMNKVANELGAVDQGRTLVACGDQLMKIASEYQNEYLYALGNDTYEMGLRMGACLTKTASEEGIIEEVIDMTDDMMKIASVWAEVGDETGDGEFCKMAEAIIEIANEMNSDADDLLCKLAAPTDGEGKAVEGKSGKFSKAMRAGWGHVKDAYTARDIRNILAVAPNKKAAMGRIFGSLKGYGSMGKVLAAYGLPAAGLAYGGKKVYDSSKRR